MTKPCKDCPSGSSRPAPKPGPRCATHHRAFVKAAAKRKHEAYVLKTYGLLAGEYDAILSWQHGVCHICQRANGASKRLAVDHDHVTGCVRGLLCGPCNDILAQIRDDVNAAYRILRYLSLDTPARAALDGDRKPG